MDLGSQLYNRRNSSVSNPTNNSRLGLDAFTSAVSATVQAQEDERRRQAAQAAANAAAQRRAEAQAAAAQQQSQPQAPKPKEKSFGDKVGDFFKGIGSGIQQGLGAVGDVALQGGGALQSISNPFMSKEQNESRRAKNLAATERARAMLHMQTDLSGNNIVGTRDVAEQATRISQGQGDVRDFLAVGGKGLQVGLDSTMFLNPARMAVGKAPVVVGGTKTMTPNLKNLFTRTVTNPAVQYAARDAAFFGGAQGVATGLQTYGQTGDLGQTFQNAGQDALFSAITQGTLDLGGHVAGKGVNKTIQAVGPAANRTFRGLSGAPREVLEEANIPGVGELRQAQIAEDATRVPTTGRDLTNPAEQTPSVQVADGVASTNPVKVEQDALQTAMNQLPTNQGLPTSPARQTPDQIVADFDEAVDASKQNQPVINPTPEQVQAIDPNAVPNEINAGDTTVQLSDAQKADIAASKGQVPPPVDPAILEAAAKRQNQEPVVPDVNEVFKNAGPNVQNTVQDIIGQLGVASRYARDTQKAMSREKGARINAGDNTFDQLGGGEAGFRGKLGSLKGEYKKSGYEPVSVDAEASDFIINAVEKSKLRSFEKLNTQNAFRKVWGANNDAPTKSDIQYVRNFLNKEVDGLGDELADTMEAAMKTKDGWQDVAAKTVGLPRALMATGDFSGQFRQAAPLGSRHPKLWADAIKESTQWTVAPKKYEAAMKQMEDSDSFNLIYDQMGVDLSGIRGLKDEGMFGADYAEKIPLVGKGVQAFDRNYTGVITKLRYDVANKVINDAGGVDNYIRNMDNLYGDKANEAMKAMGEVINTFSGRGGKRGGFLDKHMKTASTLLFAPRLWAANLQRLNPVWYASLYKRNPEAAKLALQSTATFWAMAGTTLGLAAAAGAQVGTDPRSADFGKIKVGNTRYDILGGQQQNLVLLGRLLTGEKMNSNTGEVVKLGEGFGSKTRLDLLNDMFQNKSNPLLGFGMRLMSTHWDEEKQQLIDQHGEEFSVPAEFSQLFVPLGASGTLDTINDTGDIGTGALLNAPAFFGVGTQTYGETDTKDKPAKNAEIQTQLASVLGSDKIRAILDDETAAIYDKASTDKANELTDSQISKVKSSLTDTIKGDYKMTKFLEDGDYDSHIAVLNLEREKQAADKTTTKKDLEKTDRFIKRAEILRDNGADPADYDLYTQISNSEFEDLLDPESDAYDPDLASRLYAIDQILTDGGVSLRTSGVDAWTKNKYDDPSGSGSGSGKKISTDTLLIGKNGGGGSGGGSSKFSAKAANLKLEQIAPVKDNDISKLRKVSVKKGVNV